MKKSPEQIFSQLKSAELSRKRKGETALRTAYRDNTRYNDPSYEELVKIIMGPNPQSKWFNYREYVKELGKMRREERELYQRADKKYTGPKIDDFVERITHGSLRINQLESLQSKRYYSDSAPKRIFTEQQLVEAGEDKEKFLEYFNEAMDKDPELIFKVMETTPELLDREKARKQVMKIINETRNVWFNQVDNLDAIFSPTEVKEILSDLMVSGKFDAFRLFRMKEYRQMFSKEEVTTFIKNNLLVLDSFDWRPFEDYIEEGYLTFEDMTGFLISTIQKEKDRSDFIDELGRNSELIEKEVFSKMSKADQEKIHECILKRYSERESGLGYLKSFVDIGRITKAEAAEIIRKQIKNNTFYSANLDFALEVLDQTEISGLIQREMAENPENLLDKIDEFKKFFKDKKQITDLIERVSDEAAYKLPKHLDILMEYVPDASERNKILNRIIENISPRQFTFHNKDFFLALGLDQGKAQEKKMIWKNKLLEKPNFDYLKKYAEDKDDLQALFTKEEILEICYKQLQLGLGDFLENLEVVRKILGGDKAFKKAILTAVDNDPEQFFRSFEMVQYLFSSEEIKKIIDRVCQKPRGSQSCIVYLNAWAPYVESEFVVNFFKANSLGNEGTLLSEIREIWQFLPEDQRQELYLKVIKNQPFIALDIKDYVVQKFPELTEDKILDFAAKGVQMNYAPKNLTEVIDQYSGEKNEEAKSVLLGQGYMFFNAANRIMNSKLGEIYLRLLHKENLGAKREADLLSTFECLGFLVEKNPELAQRLENIEDINSARKMIFSELLEQMGFKEKVFDQQVDNFFKNMESPVPLTVYYAQYKDSPEHAEILKNILKSLLADEYQAWKYGDLQELKARNYIPQNLKPEQYKAWQQDDSSSLFESLETSTEEAALSIRQDLTNNLFHFKIKELEGIELDESLLADIVKELASVGQELAKANKAISELKKNGQIESDEYKTLLMSGEQLKADRNLLITIRSMVRLANLKPQEVASGYLMEGKDAKKKGDTLNQVIDSIARAIDPEGKFVLEGIKQKINSFRSQNKSKQNLICADSGTAEDFLLVGSRPVGSCQHYLNGSYNDCLLGYSGPEVKILMLRNEKDKVVARSIFRLLSDENGDPVLHVEQIYSSSMNFGVFRAIYSHALKKSESLGIPVCISSSEVEGEATASKANKLTETFNFGEKIPSLISYGTRAPKVYVDSAGGARSFGKYAIKHSVRLEPKE
jgi:hypothetical protein